MQPLGDRRQPSRAARSAAAGIDRSVRRLAAIKPPTAASDETEHLRRFRPSVVAEALVRQRVLLRGLAAIRTSDAGYAELLGNQAIARWRGAIIDRVRGRYNSTIDRLDATARQIGVTVWLTRGAASIARTGQSSMRDLGDLDLMVATAADGYALADALGDQFVPEANELPWLKARPDGVMGEINLHDPSGSSPNVDIHFGGYPVRHCASLPAPIPTSQPGVAVCDRSLDLAYLIANASNDHAVTAKDLNELCLALFDETVDWASVVEHVRSATLLEFLGTLFDALHDSAALGASGQARLRSLRSQCGRERFHPISELLWPTHWRQRWLAHIDHAFRHSRSSGLVQAVRVASAAAAFHRVPIRTEVVPSWRARPPRLGRLNPWTVVFLVPAQTVVSELGHIDAVRASELAVRDGDAQRNAPSGVPVAIRRWPEGDLVVAGDRVYIPSTYRKIPRALASALRV